MRDKMDSSVSEVTPLITDALQTGTVEYTTIEGPLTSPRTDGAPEDVATMTPGGILATGCLSFGCHFASQLLGPLKLQVSQDLGLSETSFAALVSSFQVINSLTPLVGFVIPRLGLAKSALICTSTIALGQLIVYSSAVYRFPGGLLLGYFVTGLGISPVAIVQESIVLARSGRNLKGKSMAVSLLIGKLGSGIATITAVPLSNSRWGSSTPFAVSFGLSLGSVLSAIVLIGSDPEPINHVSEFTPAPQRGLLIRLKELIYLGDRFWVYVLLCALCGGLWFPFIHLSTDMFSTLFGSSATVASRIASLPLFVPLIIYPILGYLLDKNFRWASPPTLLPFASLLTLSTLIILAISTLRESFGQFGAMIWFAIGRGAAPLLLVAVVPKIVNAEHFSAVLGIHKAIEMAGSTVSQTVTGIILSSKREERSVLMVRLVKFFILLNLAEILLASALTCIPASRIRAQHNTTESVSRSAILRGQVGLGITLFLILASWLSFLWAIIH